MPARLVGLSAGFVVGVGGILVTPQAYTVLCLLTGWYVVMAILVRAVCSETPATIVQSFADGDAGPVESVSIALRRLRVLECLVWAWPTALAVLLLRWVA